MKIFLAVGATDMRKQVNGLSMFVADVLEQDPFSGHLFGFCNKARNIVKLLYYDVNGFCVWYKKLETGRFTWPKNQGEVLGISARELGWLLDGLSLEQKGAHRPQKYSVIS
ncbi:IS66 family insertion sequence element accessory protein TnpB [Patescibacteria group bacterium]|nr:IS66 family insertion sequence element accessory protein TnpB [Patescibacteria group bacterium]